MTQVLVGVLTRDGVEKDKVLKVGYLTTLPALGHVGCLEQLLWCSQRDTSTKSKTEKQKLKHL